jgi:anti-anti-sigma regulatory factor
MTSIKEKDMLVVDAAGVTSVDAAGLQLLCSAHRMALLMKRKMVLGGDRPQILRHAIEESGYARSEGCTPDGRGDCIWIGGETNG